MSSFTVDHGSGLKKILENTSLLIATAVTERVAIPPAPQKKKKNS